MLHIIALPYGKQLHTVHLVRISKFIEGNMNVFVFYEASITELFARKKYMIIVLFSVLQ